MLTARLKPCPDKNDQTYDLERGGECVSERVERNTAGMRVYGDSGGEKEYPQGLHGVGGGGIVGLPDFLCDLSHSSGESGFVSGAGVDPAGLFYAADFAYDSGGGDCPANNRDAAARVARAIRQTSADCAVDAAVVVLCVGDWCDYLFHGVPDLCAEVRWQTVSNLNRS